MSARILVINETNAKLETLSANDIFKKCRINEALEILKNEAVDIIILDQKAQDAQKFISSLAETIKIANIDELTKLHNRHYFNTKGQNLFEESSQNKQDLSLIFIDVDNFKKINDQHGHLVGDETLKNLAKIFKESIRESDILARFGGDEFILLLPNTDINIANMVASRIKDNISCLAIKTTISIGISTLSDAKESLEDLINKADKDLYLNKKTQKTFL